MRGPERQSGKQTPAAVASDSTVEEQALREYLSEIRKDRPSRVKIKTLLGRAGVPYTKDPYDQLAGVLSRLGVRDLESQGE